MVLAGFVKSLGGLAAEGDCESSVEKGTAQLRVRPWLGLIQGGHVVHPDSLAFCRNSASAGF